MAHYKYTHSLDVVKLYSFQQDEIWLAGDVTGADPGQGGGGGVAPGQGDAGAKGDEGDNEQCPGQPHHIRVTDTRWEISF